MTWPSEVSVSLATTRLNPAAVSPTASASGCIEIACCNACNGVSGATTGINTPGIRRSR